MTEPTRRRFLKTGTVGGTLGLSGCLRLSENENSETESESESGTNESSDSSNSSQESSESETNESSDSSNSSQESSNNRSEELLSVEWFSMDGFNADGSIRDVSKLGGWTGDESLSINGSWSGDRQIFETQACGRYSFDLLEGGSVIRSSEERIVILGYQYVLSQSAEAAFITYQPSVGEDWDQTLKLSYPDGEDTVTPVIRPNDGVFEFNFSEIDLESGRYNWTFEITPPDSFTLPIGSFNEQLISVSPSDSDSFQSREEAIQNASAASNASATSIEPPRTLQGDGLEVRDGGIRGSAGSAAGQHIAQSVEIHCTSDCSFGPGTDRQFRINNHTTDSSLIFTPG